MDFNEDECEDRVLRSPNRKRSSDLQRLRLQIELLEEQVLNQQAENALLRLDNCRLKQEIASTARSGSSRAQTDELEMTRATKRYKKEKAAEEKERLRLAREAQRQRRVEAEIEKREAQRLKRLERRDRQETLQQEKRARQKEKESAKALQDAQKASQPPKKRGRPLGRKAGDPSRPPSLNRSHLASNE